VTREELAHFLAIVDDLAGAERLVGDAQKRLADEGLTKLEADLVIRTWMQINGQQPPAN